MLLSAPMNGMLQDVRLLPMNGNFPLLLKGGLFG